MADQRRNYLRAVEENDKTPAITAHDGLLGDDLHKVAFLPHHEDTLVNVAMERRQSLNDVLQTACLTLGQRKRRLCAPACHAEPLEPLHPAAVFAV